jgi:hypothetical protein
MATGLLAAYFALSMLYEPIPARLYGQSSLMQDIKFQVPQFTAGNYFPSVLSSMSSYDVSEVASLDAVALADGMMITVHHNTYHCKYYNSQNYVHWVAKRLFPFAFEEYGLLDWRYFQCGFCHQRNLLLVEMLMKAGFDANLRGLNGHVIAEYNLNGDVYWIDADYGVSSFVMPKEALAEAVVIERYSGLRKNINGKDFMSSVITAFKNYDNDAYYNLTSLGVIAGSQRLLMNLVGGILVGLIFTTVASLTTALMVLLSPRRT